MGPVAVDPSPKFQISKAIEPFEIDELLLNLKVFPCSHLEIGNSKLATGKLATIVTGSVSLHHKPVYGNTSTHNLLPKDFPGLNVILSLEPKFLEKSNSHHLYP